MTARKISSPTPGINLDKLFLFDLMSRPTSPYREKFAFQCLVTRLDAFQVPHFFDPVGNLVVGVGSKKDYLKLIGAKSTDPVRFFVAHADHPGFHGEKWLSPSRLSCKWHGGSPIADLLGASVWVCNPAGDLVQATVSESKLIPTNNAIESLVVDFNDEEFPRKNSKATQLFGGFSFRRPVWQEGDTIYSKAADDLVGAFSIVSLACDLLGTLPSANARSKRSGQKKKPGKKSAPFIGLITRAEEVGFIGCIGHLELGWFRKSKRPLLGVSLETSRTLPGAEFGKGPVVRLGDRAGVFDSGALRIFSDIALKVLPGKHQRRVMDGGTCEATAFTAYGIKCVGISVPLGNYHNQNFQGGPDARAADGPAPEFVNLSDISGLLTLCSALMEPKVSWTSPWNDRLKGFQKSFRAARVLLK